MALIKWTLVDWRGTKSNNATAFRKAGVSRTSPENDEIYIDIYVARL